MSDRRKDKVTCEGCGCPFFPLYGSVRRFCSAACFKTHHRGEKHSCFKGGRVIAVDGYAVLRGIGNRRGKEYEHVVIAQHALGKKLPTGAQVHHVNHVRFDNRNCNLVICQDAKYHRLLHALARIRRSGARPFEELKCVTCHVIKPRSEFAVKQDSSIGRASSCKVCLRSQARLKRDAMKRDASVVVRSVTYSCPAVR